MSRARMRELLDTLGTLRARKEDTEDAIKSTQAGLVDLMEDNDVKTISSDRFKGTRVTTERVSIDEDRLKKELGHKVWAKVTTPKLDKEKLEAAIAMDLVDPMVVARCSSTSESSYIRVSQKKGQ